MWMLWSLMLCQITPLNFPVQAASMLQNYSFEAGETGCCQVPPGWENCGDSKETPPDVHCHQCDNPFGVKMTAPHGKHFLAMVVRSNGSRECLKQELQVPMEADSSYRLRLMLGKSITFNSMDRITREPCSYAHLAGLIIYGMSKTGFVTELGRIRPFSGSGWTEYNLKIQPSREIIEVIFELSFLGKDAYNGHLLLDYLRLIPESSD
ncbi:MAG: hypothetical protein GYB31_05340 [Bacteroidetes bacterium]|nr:hypothetical protein [Bacteroidota bacterium]